ncbi:MAG: hypothetical protein IPL46_06885 [Saprospiraceae bacterium]|nr:hypothetical protein [Saprospiraceae bacterium]
MSKDLKNQFDQIIKNALGDHQVPYDGDSWDMLEHRMSATDMSEERSVDELARQAVSDLKVPYNAATWQVLSERLDRINYRKRLIASKVFEAAVIFFAIFTMVKFLGQVPQVQELLPKAFVQNQADYDDEDTYPVMKQQPGTDQDPQINATTNGIASVQDAKISGDRALSPGAKVHNLSDQISLRKLDQLPAISQYVVSEKKQKQLVSRKSADNIQLLQSRDLSLTVFPRSLGNQHRVASVPLLPVFDMALLQAETATDFHLLAAVKPEPKIKTKLGLFSQYNSHLVRNIRYGSSAPTPQQHPESSRGQGFVANIQFGRFGFDLGASYGEVSYDAGYGRNEIQKLQIPLNLRYNGVKTKYVDFYALMGASAHGVMNAHYEAPVLLAAAPGPKKPEPRFNDGLLKEGYKKGYSKNNTYFSFNAGVGADIPIYKNMNFFVEAIYQDHWKGELGYTADKFRTYSYNVGASYNFD